jgi:ABC-2 type transport system permease protein
MNWNVIRTLVLKEIMIYFRNKFLAVITVLALVAYIIMYFLLPSEVNYEMEIALYLDGDVSAEAQSKLDVPFFVSVAFETEEELMIAVEEGDYPGGIVLSAEDENSVKLYLSANADEQINDALKVMVGSLFNTSETSMVNIQMTVLPEENDLAGESLAMSKRIIPMFGTIILVMEIMGLSGLIAEERSTKTLQALLVTPMTITDFFVAKAIMGVGLAFIQAVILMAFVGGLSSEPFAIFAILFFGAMLVTGLSFVIGAFGRDMMSNIGWIMLVMFASMIPALTVMFPGTSAEWIKIIPSYYIVDGLHQIINFGATGADVMNNIVMIMISAVVSLVIGVEVLKRRLT